MKGRGPYFWALGISAYQVTPNLAIKMQTEHIKGYLTLGCSRHKRGLSCRQCVWAPGAQPAKGRLGVLQQGLGWQPLRWKGQVGPRLLRSRLGSQLNRA